MSRKAIVIVASVMAFFTVLIAVALVVESLKSSKIQAAAKKLEFKKPKFTALKKIDYSVFEKIIGGEGREMVLIPSGSFMMGGGKEGDIDEQPQRVIYLDPYYIDLYEVTNEDYRKFTKMVKRRPPTIPVFEDDVTLLKGDRQPVVGVTWLDAFAFCQWARKRIPTEAEWEKAASGQDGEQWPWGDTFNPELTNGRGEEDGYKYSAPVGSFEGGRSPYGLYDMAGNVSEWVSDWYDEFYYEKAPFKNPQGPDEPDINKVLSYRGGSYNSTSHDLRAAKRFGGAHLERGESSVGFRCARDHKEK